MFYPFPQVQQQTEIEVSVHETTAEFLRHMSSKLQDQGSNWSSRREEDYSNLEHELEQLRQAHQRDSIRLREMEEKYAKELRIKQVGIAFNSSQYSMLIRQLVLKVYHQHQHQHQHHSCCFHRNER